MNTQWQRLSHDEFRQPQQAGQTEFYVSPFEIPEAYRSSLDAKSDCVKIEFRYLDAGEPLKQMTLESGVIAEIGKTSFRLFSLSIPTAFLRRAIEQHLSQSQAAALEVNSVSRRLGGAPRDNYRVTSGIIEQNRIAALVAG
jgi:hypothetical protein